MPASPSPSRNDGTPKDGTPSIRSHFYGVAADVFEVALHEPGADVRNVPERLVQHIWQDQHFDTARLKTTSGDPVVVLDPGRLNTDTGPDFTAARLRIGDTEWRGSVEVHTTSGGWYDHRHHTDARYNSVVLHVTLQADVWTGGLRRADETLLPEVVLYPLLEAPLRQLLYTFYTQRPTDILCAAPWKSVPDAVRTPWLQTLARERLHEKAGRIAATARTGADLEQALYENLFKGLGYAKNADAMHALARRVPLTLARRLTSRLDLEALFFGVAGLLPAPADLLESDRETADYTMELRERFDRLRHRFEVSRMEPMQWQFFRLRPANFPPLRIAQGIALLHAPGLLHEAPLERLRDAVRAPKPLQALRRLCRVRPSPFWNNHIRLDRSTRPRNPTLGRQRADALIVNALAPVVHVYADREGHPDLSDAVLSVLHDIRPARDEVTRRFAGLGTPPANAVDAQGLHQLYRTRCRQARCLSCAIGRHLLATSGDSAPVDDATNDG